MYYNHQDARKRRQLWDTTIDKTLLKDCDPVYQTVFASLHLLLIQRKENSWTSSISFGTDIEILQKVLSFLVFHMHQNEGRMMELMILVFFLSGIDDISHE